MQSTTSRTRKHPIFVERSVFIGIDKSIVDTLHLTENDCFVEEVTNEGILLRRQTEQKKV